MSVRTWALGALAAVVVATGAWLGAAAYLKHRQDRATPPPEFRPTAYVPPAPGPIAARLFAARTAAERRAAVSELDSLMPDAGVAVAAALDRSLAGAESPEQQRNQLAAIRLLARAAPDVASPALERAAQKPALRDECKLSRAMLGDGGVLTQVSALWRMHLRRAVFLRQCIDLTAAHGDPGVQLAGRRVAHEADRCAAALRRIGQPAVNQAAAEMWTTWGWLGQTRAEAYADALFEIAMPTPATELDIRKEVTANVRAARDALKTTATDGSTAARAAAALVLKQCAPQYATARERILALLAADLPSATAYERGQIVWTLAVLTGRDFAGVTSASHPADVGRAAVDAAAAWATAAGVLAERVSTASEAEQALRPRLQRRVLTAARQLETGLLRQLRGESAEAIRATDAWLASDLPWNGRVAALIDPAQRRPHYPALAGAMVIAAGKSDREADRALSIWAAAMDQPSWVRNLARTALAALAARRGDPVADWPRSLEAEGFASLAAAAPEWSYFGRAIALGGERLRKRLKDAADDALPDKVRDTLRRVADEALWERGAAAQR